MICEEIDKKRIIMGVTRLTAMEIQSNEVRVSAKGPFKNKKYGMVIHMIRNGEIHKSMLSVDYGYYDTKKIAIKEGNDLVKQIREIDLSKI